MTSFASAILMIVFVFPDKQLILLACFTNGTLRCMNPVTLLRERNVLPLHVQMPTSIAIRKQIFPCVVCCAIE